eukprot:CAMPEP_0202968116 /NCGR_PEP_ID=MMETSP1396-20130829/13271_1 /ASSEMBLY_ACC=CAM_ASM_000872 /TAXON_ID= /ORGANISM="Pseudokeronopsis sp., Strain Brazil" /LENGTH=102 /DNA_ID=CAMNT_0049694035 /DNA_START=514 /DNA_END=821 /DNA_ORIENTATION=-
MNVQPKVGHSNKISTQKLMCVDEKPLLHSKEIILKPHLSQTPSNNMGCLERKESSNAVLEQLQWEECAGIENEQHIESSAYYGVEQQLGIRTATALMRIVAD